MFKIVKIVSGGKYRGAEDKPGYSEEVLFRTAIFDEIWPIWEQKVHENAREIHEGHDTGVYTGIVVMDATNSFVDPPKHIWDKIYS